MKNGFTKSQKKKEKKVIRKLCANSKGGIQIYSNTERGQSETNQRWNEQREKPYRGKARGQVLSRRIPLFNFILLPHVFNLCVGADKEPNNNISPTKFLDIF